MNNNNILDKEYDYDLKIEVIMYTVIKICNCVKRNKGNPVILEKILKSLMFQYSELNNNVLSLPSFDLYFDYLIRKEFINVVITDNLDILIELNEDGITQDEIDEFCGLLMDIRYK